MTEILRPDLCVIGGGPGGIAAARTAASLGAKVVLVEKRPLGATDYLHLAWQAQILMAAGARSATLRSNSRFGMSEPDLRIDFKRLRRESEAAIQRFTREESAARLTGLNIRILQSAGQFTSPRRFEAGDTVIEARKFLLAIGSFTAAPSIPGLELIRPLTPDRFAELTAVPKRLAIIGATPEHLALGQAFLRLGAKVVLVQTNAFLEGADPELTTPLQDALRQEGLEIVGPAEIRGVEVTGGAQGAGLRLVLADSIFVEATHLLHSFEQRPLVEGLGLKAAHVTYDKNGIKLKPDGCSSNGRIYAIRDGLDSLQALATARRSGETVAATLLGQPDSAPPATARIIATDPEIAFIGLSEKDARAARRPVRVLRAGFCDNLRALSGPTLGRHTVAGHVKIITDSHGYILGAGIVGPHARELISVFGLALAKRLKAEDLAGLAADEPTLMEICRAAVLASAPQTGKAALRWRLFPRRSSR
ncbi:MAG: FAD-dependent oxidoreductase [Methylovirgula sp.]